MHATVPSASPPRSPTVPDGGGLSDWKSLSNDPLLRTGRETVLPARRSRDGREAWLHVVTDNSPENINLLQRHFRTLAPVALPPDWATLAGSGVDESQALSRLSTSARSNPLFGMAGSGEEGSRERAL